MRTRALKNSETWSWVKPRKHTGHQRCTENRGWRVRRYIFVRGERGIKRYKINGQRGQLQEAGRGFPLFGESGGRLFCWLQSVKWIHAGRAVNNRVKAKKLWAQVRRGQTSGNKVQRRPNKTKNNRRYIDIVQLWICISCANACFRIDLKSNNNVFFRVN